MATVTNQLLDELNKARGKAYPDVGYLYFADVVGSGVYSPRVYEVINPGGGVTLSDLNDVSSVKRCNKIRAAILKAKGV